MKPKDYLRKQIYCEFCADRNRKTTQGYPVEAAYPHHVIFRSQGGKDNKENLLAVCIFCDHQIHSSGLSWLYKLAAIGLKCREDFRKRNTRNKLDNMKGV